MRLTGARAVSTGVDGSCALLSNGPGNGTVQCWGYGLYGELGNGSNSSSGTPVSVSGLTGPAIAVSSGDSHACALLSDGSVQCWGYNADGELGDGTMNNSPVAVTVGGLSGATAIAAGGQFTCAIVANGKVECWGHDRYGELGNGITTSSPTPVPVSGLQGVVALSAGMDHSCAITSDGSLLCWGSNSHGQIGVGTTGIAPTPVAVSW
jgi:alpha-tubulin suppressor-like RCC1 family protein